MSKTDIFKPCRGCGKQIGGRGSRNFCLQCTRARAALNHANRVKWGMVKDEPKPVEVKPREDLSHVFEWVRENEPVRKCQISAFMFGDGNMPEKAIYKLERNGYLLSENERGELFAFMEVG